MSAAGAGGPAATATRSEPPATPASRPARRPLGLDGFEWACAIALLALSLAFMTALLVRVWVRGGYFTGGDGFLVVDQLQYLNWTRQAGEGLLIENLYDLADGPRSFLHPGLALSGLLYALGLGPAAAYLALKPLAVAGLFAGVLAIVRRFLARTDDRRLALVLALFAIPPVAAVVGWSGIGGDLRKFQFDLLAGELWSGTYLWGYLFTAIAVGMLPLALLAYERGRAGRDGAGPRWGMLGWAATAGLLCAWLQPWQGATLAILLVAVEAVDVARRRRDPASAARDLVLPLCAIAAPLVYYLALSKLDPAWELAGVANAFPRVPWWVLAIGFAPFALPALLGYRVGSLRTMSFGDLALRVWPLAALTVYFLPFGTFPFHAWQGMQIPLVVLAVIGVRNLLGTRALPLVPVVLVAVLAIVPGIAYRADQARDAVRLGFQPFFLTDGERDALRHLDADPEAGGVLAPVYTGLLVPAYTGRETYIGAGSWTPDFESRRVEMERLFAGELTPAQAERLVRSTGARFLLSDCHDRADIGPIVAGFTDPPRRFGCATVYRVRPGR